ncbi:PilX N-terminal domain-containing pilus assembly protein [Geomonas sp. Red32]|uniref:PilX N-terminal domain-containing pilus assembly protein n=1 Tax=Geomonas sp. Red32 TaxID=2912856 RepID=UPI00202CF962|nr:PilX N-terminal domain-containing pilus assembly protein [Geomonas sp. Red32]MCM0083174.1 PilX N-terminal domain-containing pilus assembly protein [Geomonas sp. Red32]
MPLKNEHGSALVISMMFLLVLTLLVTVVQRDALLEFISSRGYEQSQHAFYQAESGLRDAHSWLAGQGLAPENSINPPAWFYNMSTAMPSADSGWSTYVVNGNFRYRYYMEHLKDATANVSGGESAKIGTTTAVGGKVHYYRITAEGSDSVNMARKVVQIVTTARY